MAIEIEIEGASEADSFDFSVHHDQAEIPATFWKARGAGSNPPPLTLIQHGGPFHKRHERSNWLAETVVERTGSAVLLIDGPIHGRRRSDELDVPEMLGVFERQWREAPGIERYVAEWSAALDAVIEQGWADPDRIAWFGMSMGTAYGIPLCASDTRIRAAALGMWGTDWGHADRLIADASRMSTPVLFQIKSEDEIFTTAGQRALFDALGSPDKCLHTFQGGHSLTAPGQLDQLLDFIARAIAPD